MFTYDANGNLTKECFHTWPEVTYQYDTENRLKAVSNTQELLMAAVYDGDGNRAFQLNYNTGAVCGYGKNMSGEVYIPAHNKNEDGSLTAEGELFSYICSETGRSYDLIEYVNDTTQEYTQVLEAYTINSGATEAYTYGNGRVSRNNYWIEARDVTHNEMSYYLYDGRGSVTGNTWYNGMVTNVYQYDPYGKVTLGSTEHTEFYGYNAESYNPNTGLEYLRARYYNPNKGRLFQEDSYLGNIADPLTLNRYAYTKNSPLNFIDPSGFIAKGIEALDAMAEGDRAHRTLQFFLKLLNPQLIATEYKVDNHPYNKSGIGYADVVYHGSFGDEVYEIKPGSYAVSGTPLNIAGRNQRAGYITGMQETYLQKLVTANPVPPVYANGSTLYAVVNGLILPDLEYPESYIKYYMYPDQKGMIYYYYGKVKPNKEYQEALDMAREAMAIYLSICYQNEKLGTTIEVPSVNPYPSIELPEFSINTEAAQAGTFTGTFLALLYLLGLVLA